MTFKIMKSVEPNIFQEKKYILADFKIDKTKVNDWVFVEIFVWCMFSRGCLIDQQNLFSSLIIFNTTDRLKTWQVFNAFLVNVSI